MALPARGILARSVGTLSVLRLRSAALAIDSPQQSQEGPRAPFAPKPILSYLITSDWSSLQPHAPTTRTREQAPTPGLLSAARTTATTAATAMSWASSAAITRQT